MCSFSHHLTCSRVVDDYSLRVESFSSRIRELQARQQWALVALAAGALVFAVLLVLAVNGRRQMFGVLAVPSIASVFAFRDFARSRAKTLELARRSSFYARGIERLEGAWRGKGTTGIDFARTGHLYESDLNILGEGSLFELMCVTRTEVGAERLAAYLLDLPTLDEARARQDAVRELRGQTGLREDVASLGKYQFQNCEGSHLRNWLSLPTLKVPNIVAVLLFFFGVASLALGVCGYAKIFSWVLIGPMFVPLLIAQAGIALALMRKVRIHLKALLALRGDVTVLRQGVELLERQQFQSAKLRELTLDLHTQNASTVIRKLERLVVAVERREDFILYAFSIWLAAGTQLVLAAERWRAAHQKEFELWLDRWAEFEALNAVACYAYEHPDDAFPELLSGAARFEAKGLAHPLLSPSATSATTSLSMPQLRFT